MLWELLIPVALQWVVTLAPVRPMTSYTQMNHDEPTNAVKETTVTSDQEEFRAPGVGEKDLLWDHVGDLTQHFILGEDATGTSTTRGFEEVNTTATLVNQIENSVALSNTSHMDVGHEVLEQTSVQGNISGEEASSPESITPNLLLSNAGRGGDLKEKEKFNRSDVQGKIILYPTDHNGSVHISDSAIGNLSKNLRKGLTEKNMSKAERHPQQIIYDTSDPFSVIFGEVKTEFRTNKLNNISKENRENIIGGLAVRRVEELLRKEDIEKSKVNGKEVTTTLKNVKILHTFEEEKDEFGSEQEEEELRQRNEMLEFGKMKSSPNDELKFPKYDIDSNTSEEHTDFDHLENHLSDNGLFKEWDTVSEEQEKMLEDMVLQEKKHIDGASRDAVPTPGRWFILLLAGNSTIVKLRQKDFAKYLKLNLAARLSLEYDEVKVNRVVLAPPRLMVNVSVVPANEGNNHDLDEEIDIEDKIFGEEEAPLHKLAETNATLLELSGEEYHVVRFLSLRSQQPIQLEDTASATSMIVNDRHMDIEMVIYVFVGGTCTVAILVTLIFALYRYLRTAPINWPWKGTKPLFVAPWSLPRHQRMGEEPTPSIGGPLTVIYSGNFVDRTAPNSGSWIEDYQPPSISESLDIPRQQPLYGFGALSNSALPEIRDSYSNIGQESPRFNLDNRLHILGCRPNHFLLPHQPTRTNNDHKSTLDVRISKAGLENPNYQS